LAKTSSNSASSIIAQVEGLTAATFINKAGSQDRKNATIKANTVKAGTLIFIKVKTIFLSKQIIISVITLRGVRFV